MKNKLLPLLIIFTLSACDNSAAPKQDISFENCLFGKIQACKGDEDCKVIAASICEVETNARGLLAQSTDKIKKQELQIASLERAALQGAEKSAELQALREELERLKSIVSDTNSYKWNMVTTWPKNYPGLGRAAENLSKYVDEMSNGRLKIKVYGAGEMVPAMGVFDAVSRGAAQLGHGASYYWTGKLKSSQFYTAVPFGLTAQEINSWIHWGGGQELWEEAYAPFNLMPFAGGNTGVQMAGWFKKEINSLDDLKGLKMRIPGLAGEIFSRAGAETVLLPGSDIFLALQQGVIDAAEWVGPFNDLTFGFHQVADYYYYPGWHEGGSTLEIIMNKEAYSSLPDDLRAIVKYAARAVNQEMLDEYTANNNRALTELVEVHGVELRKLPDDVLIELRRISEEVMEEFIKDDEMATKIYNSYRAFKQDVIQYHEISEKAFIEMRDLEE